MSKDPILQYIQNIKEVRNDCEFYDPNEGVEILDIIVQKGDEYMWCLINYVESLIPYKNLYLLNYEILMRTFYISLKFRYDYQHKVVLKSIVKIYHSKEIFTFPFRTSRLVDGEEIIEEDYFLNHKLKKEFKMEWGDMITLAHMDVLFGVN